MPDAFEELPDLYWHVAAKAADDKRYAVVNDLNRDTLLRTIVRPWLAGQTITIGGRLINPKAPPQEMKITQTQAAQNYYVSQHEANMNRSGIADFATDRRLLPLGNGIDHTFDLLFAGPPIAPQTSELNIVLDVCRRLPEAARILANRSRKGKLPFEIEDEYDVQDLLHAVIRSFLRYSVTEDPISKVASTRSGRADISIEEFGLLIEVKYARSPNDQKRIFEEFSQDLVLYARWPHLKTLIFFIYNARDLRDPDAFSKLGGAHEVSGVRFYVYVILA